MKQSRKEKVNQWLDEYGLAVQLISGMLLLCAAVIITIIVG